MGSSSLLQRGRRELRSRNYEYGVQLYLIHLKVQPDDLAARRELRRAQRAHRRRMGGVDALSGAKRAKLRSQARRMRIDPARPQDSILACEELLELDPDNVPAMVTLGRAAAQAGLQEVALWSFQEALRCHPRNRDAREALASMCGDRRVHLRVAEVLYERGDYEGAVPHLELARSASDHRSSGEAHFLLALCLLRRGESERAIKELFRARREFSFLSDAYPRVRDVCYLLAKAYEHQGRQGQATRWYGAAGEPPPPPPEIVVAEPVLAEPPVAYVAPPRRPRALPREPWFTEEGWAALLSAAVVCVVVLIAATELQLLR